MLRDVAFDRVTTYQECTDADRTVGREMVQVMIEELEKAERQGLLVAREPASRLGPATRDLAMNLQQIGSMGGGDSPASGGCMGQLA